MKHPAKNDVSVLILFFNRPDHLKAVFDEVRKARPARLFLYQDGPRGERDMAGIEACRQVVADIDWECEVHRKYQESARYTGNIRSATTVATLQNTSRRNGLSRIPTSV